MPLTGVAEGRGVCVCLQAGPAETDPEMEKDKWVGSHWGKMDLMDLWSFHCQDCQCMSSESKPQGLLQAFISISVRGCLERLLFVLWTSSCQHWRSDMLPLGDMAFYYLRENDLICSETGDRRDLIYTGGLLLAWQKILHSSPVKGRILA